MPFDADDLAAFYDSDMPGYVAATVGGVAVSGLFRDAWADAMGIGGTGPGLLIAAADATSATLGTTVVVAGITYTVAGIEPGVAGMTRLRLTES